MIGLPDFTIQPPTQISINNQKGTNMNDNVTPKLFSQFQILRLVNPVAFYSTETQQNMIDAHKFHGPKAFYDLQTKGGGFFEVDA